MRPLRKFSDYLDEGTVKQQSPDPSRSRSLQKESEKTRETLKEHVRTFGITDTNANTIIKSAYDAIMELVRAAMLNEGYNASGAGAHEAEVAYLREFAFSEKDVQFCDQLRYFRNGILYYGKSFDKEYAEKVIAFLEKTKEKLENNNHI